MVRSRMTTTWVLLALIASSTPVGVAQAPDPCEPDCLRIQAFSLKEEPYVISDGTNTVEGELVNNGSTPLQVRAYIEATWNGGQESMSPTTYLIPAGTAEDVEWGWNGPGLDQKGIADQVTLRLVAWVEAGGQEVQDTRESQSIVRPVQYNDFDLAWVSGPPDTVTRGETASIAEVRVTNTGNVDDTAVLSFEGAGPWVLTAVPGQVPLVAGASATVSVVAEAPGQLGSQTTFNVVASTSETRSNELKRSSLGLATPVVVDGTQVVVDIDPLNQAVDPGNSTTYTVTVLNPTAGKKTVDIGFEGGTQDVSFSGLPQTGIELDPGEDQTIQLQAFAQVDALAGTLSGWVNTTDDDGFQSSVPISLEVNQTHAVDATIDATQALPSPVPSQTMAIPLNVTNLGNGDDTICIEAELPADWTADEPCIEVEPDPETWNHTVPFEWSVTLASWAATGDQSLVFSAQSEDATVPNSTGRRLDFTVPERTHPVIDPPVRLAAPAAQGDGSYLVPAPAPCTLSARPGQALQIPLTLRNDGNAEGNFTLAATDPDGWTLKLPAETTYALGKRATEDVVVSLEAPDDLGPGDRAEFTLQFTDADAADPPTHQVACAVSAAFPDLTVAEADAFATPSPPYADHASTLRFQVLNVGWNATGAPVQVTSVVKDPGGEEIHRQTHTLDALDAITGDWWRILEVDFTATTPGEHNYTIIIDPDGDIQEPDGGDAASNVLEGTVDLLDFGVDVDAPGGRSVIPEQHVSFEQETAFTVTNGLGVPRTVNVSITMDPPWRTFPAREIDLARKDSAGDSADVEVKFTIPAVPRTGEVRITVRAADPGLPTLAVEDTVRIRIDDLDAPVITNVTSDVSHVLDGGTVDFTADIHDATGVSEARLYVVAPDGSVAWEPMNGSEAGGAFAAPWTFAKLGIHEVHVWARDGSVSNHTNDTRPEPVLIEVLPTDRPHIRLVTPEDGAAVRPGVPLVFTVLSQRPVIFLSYERDGADAFDMQVINPAQVATDGWSDGPTSIRLVARDALGAQAVENYTFQIDGTPPKVTGLEIAPDGAMPGDDVRVAAHVHDAGGIASVVLRIEHISGRSEDLSMQQTGGQTWSVDASLPEDVRSVAIIATDKAGNRGYGERLFEALDDTGDKQASGAPAAALLVAVAFLLRRRWREP